MSSYIIGRSEKCDIVVDDMTVSRRHAEIEEIGGGRFALRDLESSYGTHIHRDGDWIEILEIEVDANTPIRLGEHDTTADGLMANIKATGPNIAQVAAPIQNLKRGAPTPTPGPRAQAPRALGGALAAKLGDKTMLWVIIGGGVLVLLTVIAVVLALTLSDDGPGSSTGTSSPRGRLIAACTKGGNNSAAACQCAVDIILKTMSKDELDLVLQIQGDPGGRKRVAERLKKMTPAQRRQWLNKFTNMGRRMKQECKVK